MAKFKGNTEDWLDDEVSKKAFTSLNPKKKKKTIERPWIGLNPEETNALVIEIFPNQSAIRLDSEPEKPFLCTYRRSILSQSSHLEKTPVAVGDRVLVKSTSPLTGTIEGVAFRKNCLVRPAAGQQENYISQLPDQYESNLNAKKEELKAARTQKKLIRHVLASNIDQVCIVAAVRNPDFSPGFVDRFLVAAESQKLPVLICLTKSDLLTSEEENSPWNIYREIGYPVYLLSAEKNIGIDSLLEHVKGKRIAFCGHSGVGKTSLLRSLLKKDIGRIGEVNPYTGKGRHTTTSAILIDGPEKSEWIDTPGVRAFGLEGVTKENLAHFFPEFRPLNCLQEGCLQHHEEGCQAKSLFRYESYMRIFETL